MSSGVIKYNGVNIATMPAVARVEQGLEPNQIVNYHRRLKSLLRYKGAGNSTEQFFYETGKQLSKIYGVVSTAVAIFDSKNKNTVYIDTVVAEVVQYKISNVEKICEWVVKHWDGSKLLPPVAFWIECITVVKGFNFTNTAKINDAESLISGEERAEVGEMARAMAEKLGYTDNSKTTYRNRDTMAKHYFILQNLNRGLVQVGASRGVEWVSKSDAEGRVVMDNSRTLELFVSGRLVESECKKAYEEQQEAV
jgi:hypothetical protein